MGSSQSSVENSSSASCTEKDTDSLSSGSSPQGRIDELRKQSGDSPYKVIKIQDLEVCEIPKWYHHTPEEARKEILKMKCNHYSDCKCHLLSCVENSESHLSCHDNSFFGAFLVAYNKHQDIILSPDDIWMVICIHFSLYVNQNAEALRKKFVNHEGQQLLTVTTHTERSESQWDEFFTLMLEQIRLNTNNSICKILEADFSTTGRVEKLVSTSVIMNSFKKYFSYGRCIPDCGIRNVRFMGQMQDWTSLIDKFKSLESHTLDKPDDSFRTYIKNLLPILDKFVDTYNNNVDVDFWNKIMNVESGRLGSGSTTYISGWILNFFGIYKRVESDSIPAYRFDFPVKIDNKMTGIKKTVTVMGGFGHIHMDNGGLRPQQFMAVYHDGVTFD